LGEEKDGITAGEAILKALRAKATKGDVRAAEVLLDRAYGKAKQTMDTNVNMLEPLVIVTRAEDLPKEGND
jgi:orotate phosphoribosyltransferase